MGFPDCRVSSRLGADVVVRRRCWASSGCRARISASEEFGFGCLVLTARPCTSSKQTRSSSGSRHSWTLGSLKACRSDTSAGATTSPSLCQTSKKRAALCRRMACALQRIGCRASRSCSFSSLIRMATGSKSATSMRGRSARSKPIFGLLGDPAEEEKTASCLVLSVAFSAESEVNN